MKQSTTPSFETIDPVLLATAVGGKAPANRDPAPSRTWGQAAREYGAACARGATEALLVGRKPKTLREGATRAAIGCATGLGTKAAADLAGGRDH